MTWQRHFRELIVRREQVVLNEKRAKEEEKINQRDHKKIVRKFHSRVAKVIEKYGEVVGYNFKETKYGVWNNYISGDYNLEISIGTTHIIFHSERWHHNSILLDDALMEDTLAEALVWLSGRSR